MGEVSVTGVSGLISNRVLWNVFYWLNVLECDKHENYYRLCSDLNINIVLRSLILR